MIEMSEGRGKMFGGGVTKLLRYGGDALLRVGEESGRRGHAGLCFFLQKGFAVIFLQQPFRLPGSQPQLTGQLLQGQGGVLIQKIFFDDDGGLVRLAGGSGGSAAASFFIVAHQMNQDLAEQGLHLKLIAGFFVGKLLKKHGKQASGLLAVLSEPEAGGGKQRKHLIFRGGRWIGRGVDAASFLCFQINTVFAHGIVGGGHLGVLHMRPGDVERAGADLISVSVDERMAAALGNVVNFKAVAAVGVAGDGALKTFVDKIKSLDAGVSYMKMNGCVIIAGPHGGASF